MSALSHYDARGHSLLAPTMYRRKLDGQIVTAVQWVTWNHYVITRFMEGAFYKFDAKGNLMLYTDDGVLVASPGDWIVQDKTEEFSTVSDRIFAQAYEWVEGLSK